MFVTAALAAGVIALVGDFDHDGRRDRAEIVSDLAGHSLVVVRLGADPRRSIIVHRSLGKFSDPFLSAAKPGRWMTACAKGYDMGPRPCRERWVRTHGGELLFGEKESSEAVAIWRGGRFHVVWLSD